jgi:hypothetical protein
MAAHIGADAHFLWLVAPLVLVIAWVRWAERRATAEQSDGADRSNIPADPDDGEDLEP